MGSVSPEFLDGDACTAGAIVGGARSALRVGRHADGPVVVEPALGGEARDIGRARVARELEPELPECRERPVAIFPSPLEPEITDRVFFRRPVGGVRVVGIAKMRAHERLDLPAPGTPARIELD